MVPSILCLPLGQGFPTDTPAPSTRTPLGISRPARVSGVLEPEHLCSRQHPSISHLSKPQSAGSHHVAGADTVLLKCRFALLFCLALCYCLVWWHFDRHFPGPPRGLHYRAWGTTHQSCPPHPHASSLPLQAALSCIAQWSGVGKRVSGQKGGKYCRSLVCSPAMLVLSWRGLCLLGARGGGL